MDIQIFVICLVAGLLLIGAEVFVPGGVLGTFGALALVGAIVAAFVAFGPTIGSYVGIAVVFLIGVSIYLWIRIFPRTGIGRQMTMSRDLSDSKATEEGLGELLGQSGMAQSDLRPAGFARINGRRVDVVSQGGLILKGSNVEVVEIEGNRVVVRQT